MDIIRQGDVLLIKQDVDTSAATPQQPANGRVVLADGEVTGHAHAIAEQDAQVMELNGSMFVVVPDEAVLVHEEHGAAQLFGGTYLVPSQVEYSPAEIRRVLD